MNVEKNIKLLLLKINRMGIEATILKETKYSKINHNVYSRYKFTVWEKFPKKYNDEGEVIEVINKPNTTKFNSSIELLKHMVVVANGEETDE